MSNRWRGLVALLLIKVAAKMLVGGVEPIMVPAWRKLVETPHEFAHQLQNPYLSTETFLPEPIAPNFGDPLPEPLPEA